MVSPFVRQMGRPTVTIKQDFVPAMTSGEFARLMAQVLERELKGWSEKGMLVRIQGVISNLEAQRQMAEARKYPKIYNIELNSDGPVTLLGVRTVFDGFSDGELVEVIGYPIINIFRGVVS